MTRELYEDGEITDDERTIFVAYQYAGSACINNTITGGAPLVAICRWHSVRASSSCSSAS